MTKQTFTSGQVLTAAQMTSLQQTAMLGGNPSAKTDTYVLVAADAGTAITMNKGTATTITVNTSLFAAGDTVTILNIGAGVCTITAGTATVSKPTNATLALVQNAGGVLYFTATGTSFFMPFDVGSSTSAYVGVSAYKSANQSINNATFTAVTFDTELFDTDSIHSTSSNTSRFTVPSGKGGKWLLTAAGAFAANTTGIRAVAVYKNGVVVQNQNQLNATSAAQCIAIVSFVDIYAVGDYVEIYAYQSSGGALDVSGLQTNTALQFSFLGA